MPEPSPFDTSCLGDSTPIPAVCFMGLLKASAHVDNKIGTSLYLVFGSDPLGRGCTARAQGISGDELGKAGLDRCRGLAEGLLALSCASDVWPLLPVATVAGSGRLGSSPQAGRSEGGGWQGLKPGMCVQECSCSAH